MTIFQNCSKCGKKLPLTSEYFAKTTTRKVGFEASCKKCRNKRRMVCYKADKEGFAKKNKQYRKDNKEAIAMQRRGYYLANKDVRIEKSREYRMLNKKDIAIRFKIRNNGNKEYLQKCSILVQRREARKHRLLSTLTNEQWESIKAHFDYKCCYCGKKLPLAQEHFIPVTKGGEYTINNIIPCCKSCNSSKGNREFSVWYHKNQHYSAKREKYILKFLGYNNESQQLKIN